MKNKEFFIKILEEEAPKFRSVIDALPEDKFSHKVHDRSREAGSLAAQLAMQWGAISGVVVNGTPSMDSHMGKEISKKEMLSVFDKGIEQLKKDVMEISDNAWENDMAKLEMPSGNWEDKKYNMAWGFLFDAIHHRGQLSTYLRAMGDKVPSIYGPSADSKN